jgi:hypothetical protein
VVSVTSRPLYPWERARYPLSREPDAPQSQSGWIWRRENCLASARIQTPDRPPRSLVVITTMLYQPRKSSYTICMAVYQLLCVCVVYICTCTCLPHWELHPWRKYVIALRLTADTSDSCKGTFGTLHVTIKFNFICENIVYAITCRKLYPEFQKKLQSLPINNSTESHFTNVAYDAVEVWHHPFLTSWLHGDKCSPWMLYVRWKASMPTGQKEVGPTAHLDAV